MDVFKVDVFTKEPFKGNPAAVVLASNIDERTMLKIAFELNMSETVFIETFKTFGHSLNKFRLRYFTPSCEVPFCGHATIGAFYALKLKGLDRGTYKAITNAGEVDVVVEDKVWFKSVTPRIVERLNLNFSDILKPVNVVDVGIKIGLVEVENLEMLLKLKPDFDKLAEFCESNDIAGIHVFTVNSDKSKSGRFGKSDASARFFAPAVGIPEDPVTGTASSALAYYLNKSGRLVKREYVFEQGHVLDRLGFVHVRVSDGVWVGGDAVCILEGELKI